MFKGAIRPAGVVVVSLNIILVMKFWGGRGGGLPPLNKLYFRFYKEEGCVETSIK